MYNYSTITPDLLYVVMVTSGLVDAAVAELVDALDSKSCEVYARAGSSPARGTNEFRYYHSDI